MTCERVHAQLTAYLDGDLDEPSASSLRGHLRLCEACRALADQHARVVDALASLAPPEPPSAMWEGVKARLGAAEIEDARRSRLALWWRRVRPQLVPGLVLAGAAAVAALWISHRRVPAEEIAVTPPAPIAHHDVAPPAPAPHPAATHAPATPATIDVREELADDDARADASYRAVAEELIASAAESRADWSAPQARSFDARVTALRTAAEHAALGLPREHAWQALIEYVQRAVVGVRVAEVP